MKRRIPLILFLIIFIAGTVAGYAWRNYPAGILLGLGMGIIVMVLARFILTAIKKQGAKPQPEPTASGS